MLSGFIENIFSSLSINFNKKSYIPDVKLAYLYGDDFFTAERNKDSILLINTILSYFHIKERFKFINASDLKNLDRYIDKYKCNSIFIFVTALGSGILSTIVEHLNVKYDMKNMFIINSYSTSDIEILNSNNIMRLLPLDGINSELFKKLLEIPNADNIIFLIQEDNFWAHNLANSIERLFPDGSILRYNITDNNIILPEGSLSILALSEPVLNFLMEILSERVNNVLQILLGDASIPVRANNQEELNFLINTNTNILLPRASGIDYNFANILSELTGLDTISPLIGVTISAIQISSYLKRCIIRRLSNYKKQYFIAETQLDQKTLNNITSVYTLLSYSQLDQPANIIQLVGWVFIDDGILRTFLANEIPNYVNPIQ